jgi:myosin heavy subunit
MDTLNRTEPHYIRCIKPNDFKKPDLFDANLCLLQLRYAGVFDAVTIRQQGFPFRWTHEVFFKRYRACGDASRLFNRNLVVGEYLSLCRQVGVLRHVTDCAAQVGLPPLHLPTDL